MFSLVFATLFVRLLVSKPIFSKFREKVALEPRKKRLHSGVNLDLDPDPRTFKRILPSQYMIYWQ